MIRGRDYRDYEGILGLNLIYMIKKHKGTEPFVWIDMCCGEGHATSGFMKLRLKNGKELANGARFIGVDKGCIYSPQSENVKFLPHVDVVSFVPEVKADLITCLYGLYLIDDKISVLARWYSYLNERGLLSFNMPPSCVKIKDGEEEYGLQKLLNRFNNVEIIDKPSDVYKITKEGTINPFGVPLALLEVIKTQQEERKFGCSIYALKK